MNDWPDTRESLILRLQSPQDTAAWEQFVSIYRPVVVRMATRRGIQHADCEDLAQGVFASLAEAVARWEPGEGRPRFRNWLGRITRNAIINALSRAKPDKAAGSSSVRKVLANTLENDGLESTLQKEAGMEAIRWAASQIEPEFTTSTWAMFCETAIVGRTPAEVAKSMNKSVGAVYVARCRVMQRIKEKVTEISDIWSFGP